MTEITRKIWKTINELTSPAELISIATVFSQCRPLILNRFMQLGLFRESESIWKLMDQDPMDVTTADLAIMAIQYLLSSSRHDDAIVLYNRLSADGQTRKKHMFLLIESMFKSEEPDHGVNLYLNEITRGLYQVDQSDLEFFLKVANKRSDIDRVLSFFADSAERVAIDDLPDSSRIEFVEFDPPEFRGHQLAPAGLSSDDREFLCGIFNTGHSRMPSKTVKYVIDGANVLYHGKAEVDLVSYIMLDRMIVSLKEPTTLVLSTKYLNPQKSSPMHLIAPEFVKLWKMLPNIQILQTPRGVNDDLYIITVALLSGAHVISNDKFRDHEFAVKLTDKRAAKVFAMWCDDHIVNFSTDGMDLKFPVPWSTKVQRLGKHICIPLKSGKWIAI